MIQKWRKLGHEKKPDEKPCWKLLLIAVAAPYGGQNRRFAKDLLDSHSKLHTIHNRSCRHVFSIIV